MPFALIHVVARTLPRLALASAVRIALGTMLAAPQSVAAQSLSRVVVAAQADGSTNVAPVHEEQTPAPAFAGIGPGWG